MLKNPANRAGCGGGINTPGAPRMQIRVEVGKSKVTPIYAAQNARVYANRSDRTVVIVSVFEQRKL